MMILRCSVLVLLLSLVCGGLAQKTEVKFGYVDWPGVTVKTQVAAQILEALGYETDTQALSVPILLKGVSEGDLHVFLGVWLPSMEGMVAEYLPPAEASDEEGDADSETDSAAEETEGDEASDEANEEVSQGDGSITIIARNLEPTIYRPAVPMYTYEAGLQSLADLPDFIDELDGKLYGIEPGNDGNQILLDNIKDDVYGMGEFELVESSTEGMLAAVGRAIRREKPIVFLGWSPHWMNAVYDITYLEDPDLVWGEDGYVGTAINTDLLVADANLAQFFKQYIVTPEMQNAWVDAYSRQGNDVDEVAQTWIAEHLEQALAWVDGVSTASGEDATEALKAAFAEN